MSWFARLTNVFRSDRVTDEIDREMAFHLQQRADDLVRQGMAPEDAAYEARRRFGNLGLQRENTRERDLFSWIDTVLGDLRYAIRGLRASPGFAAIVIVSLALGIGANTAIFSVINVAMLKSLPLPDADRLVQLTIDGGAVDKSAWRFSAPMAQAIRERQDMFTGVLAYSSTGSGDLSTGGESRPIAVGLVSGNFFSTLSIRPAAGRLLVDADDRRGCDGVVVLTHAFWQREFGGDHGVVGRPVHINGRAFEVIGVADPAFFGLEYGYYPPVWAPQCAGSIIRGPTYSGGGALVGRLKPGATLEQARARLQYLTSGILAATLPPTASADDAARHRRITLGAVPFARGLPGLRSQYGQALLILMAVVGIVLLIACANSANLLLARATTRQREFAVRLALGASRWRLMTQLLTESILLALLSAGIGALFAVWGTGVLLGFMSRRGRPMLLESALDGSVLGFTVVVAVLTGVVFGLAPAWRVARVDPQAAMKRGGRGVADGRGRFTVGKGLVVAQIALSLLMLTGAGLLVGSWQRLANADPGFRSDGVTLVSVNSRAASIPDSQRSAVFLAILDRLRSVPGVEAASAANRTPIGNSSWSAEIEADGAAAVDKPVVQLNEVSERYFATMGTRFLSGRDFEMGDTPTSSRVVVVNDELARRFFGNRSPLGQQVRIRWSREPSDPYEIVGVVADTKDQTLDERNKPILYLSLRQNRAPEAYINFAIRSDEAAPVPAAGITAAIMDAHPRLSLSTRAFTDQVEESMRLPRTVGLMSAFFGALALLLATIGLYGIVAYNVARRRNEIGVRIALGAERVRIIRMVLVDVTRIVGVGVAIGLVASFALLRLVGAFLYGIRPSDPPTFMLSTVTLAAVALIAALVPAWRAGKVDPISALRAE